MIDSLELTNRVIERMGDEVLMVGGEVYLHRIIRATVDILAEEGIVELEDLGGEEE